MLNEKTMQTLNTLREKVCRNLGKRMAALVVMVIITVVAVVPVMAATKPVELTYNGRAYTLQTTSTQTELILRKAQAQYPEIRLTEKDRIVRADSADGSVIRVQIQSAYVLPVTADGVTTNINAYYGEPVADVLRDANLTLGANDVTTPAADKTITGKNPLVVTRRFKVTLAADGETKDVVVPKGSVQDALKSLNVTLGENDTVNQELTRPVHENMPITVNRVEFRDVTVEEPVAFETVTKQDNALAKGKIQVETQGENGSQSVMKRQRLVDGKVADELVLKTVVTKQPKQQVKRVGTKAKSAVASVGTNGTLTDQNGKQLRYSRVLTGKCSAYTGGGTTSTGRPAAFGLVAVNPKIIPYGTKLYIASPNGKVVYGYAIAADTGGGVMKGRIIADLYYDTYEQCKQIGLRNMNVYILS